MRKTPNGGPPAASGADDVPRAGAGAGTAAMVPGDVATAPLGGPVHAAEAGPGFLVVAHRGAAAEAPENTLDAFDLALELGADALELDVRRTRDGVLVCMHDASLDRTTDGSGEVARLQAARVLAASATPRGAAGEERRAAGGDRRLVPRLRDVFGRYPDVEITVDVKDPDATEDVVRLIGEFDRARNTILYVEDGTAREAFRAYPGRTATSIRQAMWLRLHPGRDLGRGRGALPGGAGGAARGPLPEVVHTPLRRWGITIVTPGFVARVNEAGRSVQVWTIDDPRLMANLADWGVKRIITNEVRAAVALRDARGRP